jgi:aspartyl protease family protein
MKTLSAGTLWFFIAAILYAVISGVLQDGPIRVAMETDGADSLILSRHRDGHFYVKATLNGQPATLLVDTGASSLAISEPLANAAGLTRCRPQQSHTANGITQSCQDTLDTLQIGAITLQQTPVSVLPKLSGPGLLGMSVLKHFRMEQDGDTMRLTLRKTS